MAENKGSGKVFVQNGQSVPTMQRVSPVDGTRGATIPPMQTVSQGSGGSTSSGDGGGKK